MKRDLHSLQAALTAMQSAYDQWGQGKYWGRFDPAAWNRLSRFMVEAGQIAKPFDASVLELKIPDFYKKVSDFDPEPIRAAARACKI